jgi:hypothetical protein
MLYLSRRVGHADRFDASWYGSPGTTAPDNPSPLRLRKRHQGPEGSLAAELRQGCDPPRDRRSAPGLTPEPFGANAGSMPIKTLAAQIQAFCAAVSR